MHWNYFYHIILLSVILHSYNISPVLSSCVLSYYADEINYNNASSLHFYYTSVGVKSVEECANFCFTRQFCHTAVYNYFAYTCSISYNWVINCWNHPRRYSQYQSLNRHLVRIACIDICKINSTENQNGNYLHQIEDVLLKSGIEIAHNKAQSNEDKQGSTTIRYANEFAIFETTTTTTINAATITDTPISITNVETITESVEENDYSTNSVIIPTTITSFSNAKILIRDNQLSNRTILQTFADETLPLWTYLQKILEKDMPTYHSGTETDDNNDKTEMNNNSQTFNNNISSRSKIRFLEEIVHELRESPSKYKVSVERIDDHQSWLVIRIGNYHKDENMHEATLIEVPKRMHAFPTNHDSPEESEANFHVLRIKFPYKLLNNNNSNKSDEREIQGKEARTDSQIDKQHLNDHVEKLNFEKLPEKYIDNQHGYLYRLQIHDINRDLPFINDNISGHEIRRDESKSRELETIENTNENIVIGTKILSAINSSCFGMINHQLLYNASYRILYDVSLERCRCACTMTWSNDCAITCKSFQYSNVTRKCLLNEDDHGGKFDLVYSLDTNYFYRICTDQDIIKNVLQNCPAVGKLKLQQFVSDETSANSDLIGSDESKTIHSTKKRSIIDDRSLLISPAQSVYWWKNAGREEVSNNNGFVEEMIISPGLWSRILKKESTAKSLKNVLIEIIEKQSEINTGKYGYDYWNEHESGTTVSHANRDVRSTKDENLEAIQKSFATKTIASTTTTISPTTIIVSSTLTTTTSSSTTTISSTPITISEIINTKTTIDLPSSYENDESLAEESEESEEITETNEQDEIREDSSGNENVKKSSKGYDSSIAKLTTKLMESEVTVNQQTTIGKDPGFDEEEGFDNNFDDYNKNYNLNEGNDITTIAKESGEVIINEKFSIPEEDSEEDTEYSDNEINETEQNSTARASGKCFEIIDGFMLKGTAGGLEQGVTLEECQCYCANSRSNMRYSFQCVSATYYHKERDCVLNLQTRNEFPKQFKQNLREHYNVSYLGMICSIEESKQRLVNPNLTDGCRQTVEIPTSTTRPRKVFQSVNTDSCFIELPNHVLHGTAFAAETDVSVEACKCYCMNAENRYGSECHSIEYYFDSMTCLLNNISRTTNPKNFNHSIAFTLMHSYFDKNCSIRNDKYSIYIKEKCLSIINLNGNFNSKKTTLYSNERTNFYDNNNGIDSNVNNIISAINPIHPVQYPDHHPPRTYHDLLQEIGEEENEEEKLEEISDSEDDNTLIIYTTTAFPTVQRFTTFTTATDSFSKLNNAVDILVTTTPTYMDYTISNDTSITTPLMEIITYPYLGKCEYSAIYQTSFRGVKLIKKFLVFSPQQCFYGCHFEGCRSLNLIQIDNQTKSCELFSDALIDYRTADVLAYDSVSVYFDGIKCMQKRYKVDKSSNSDNDYNTIDNEDYDKNNSN